MLGKPASVELVENDDEACCSGEDHSLVSRGLSPSSDTAEVEGKPENDQRTHWLGWTLFLVFAGVVILSLVAVAFAWVEGWFERRVQFFVVGDWGRDGLQNQSAVADAMAAKARQLAPEFIVSVGDNMYESGLVSAEDSQFTTSFTDVYHHEGLQVPWHVILGNHDYGEYWNETIGLKSCPDSGDSCYFSPLHQLNQTLVERDWRWHCERSFQLSLGLADFFFIDTNPFISDYREQPWAANRGGIHEQSWESQALELEARLAASEAPWKLVFGHHPVRNNHMPSNTPELMEHVEPVLQERGVQAYFSGHEHNLQHLHVGGAQTHYIVSGGGSKADYFPARLWDNGGSRFQHQGSGFAACILKRRSLTCDFIGIEGTEPLYTVAIKNA